MPEIVMIARKKSSYFTTVEILFMASMIGLDFAYGLIVGPLLSAAGILEFIRLDMVVPVMMMLTTRLVIDRFGTLIVYEFVWVVLAILAKPSSFGLPGFMKLFPALAYGIILDSLMELFRRNTYLRLFVAGILGGILNQFALFGIRILFGLPWSTAIKVVLGINLITGIIINIIGVHLAWLVWNGLVRSGWVARIRSWRTS
jgi:hypothetical protein